MNGLTLLWHDYKYFPYERLLAQREAATLFGVEPQNAEDGLLVCCPYDENDVARLTYFKAARNGRSLTVPLQAKLEASGNGNGSTWDHERMPIPSLRRQSTRYSAHGLHEYRGKFNPQVVRAIGNLFDIAERAWVFDPFCGSGTTLLEAAHIGWNAIGLDINPLAVMVANAKIAAFNASPDLLQRQCDVLQVKLSNASSDPNWRDYLPEPGYLEKWFPSAVLGQVVAILKAVEEVRPTALQDVFRVLLSDICREVSLQDPSDLRIRRRKNPAQNYPALELFIARIQTKVTSVIRARQHVEPKSGTVQFAIHGDTRNVTKGVVEALKSRRRKGFDAAITSPPYATAMPYLDTQRLSLALLGLIGSRELRRGEKSMIGNREIQDKERNDLESQLKMNSAALPDMTIAFCRKLLDAADHPSHGFRRRNVPALVYKYLADMASMFSSVQRVIRRKGYYSLLIGRNATELSGKEILIDTPQLLAEVAESRGWKVEETLAFDTYHRYDLHQNNSIREEVLLVLRR